MKKNNGITLISLIITIIILLIIAGVVLNLALGNNGIFKLASKASKNYADEAKREENMLDTQYLLGSRDNITLTKDQYNNIMKRLESLEAGVTVPAGTVISYIAGTTPPTGYLACDGKTYNISDYPTLAEAIKSGFSNYNYYGGDGETTFAVPNLQGEFLRGYTTSASSSKTQGITTRKCRNSSRCNKAYYGWNIT